jgi:hypothetical protein
MKKYTHYLPSLQKLALSTGVLSIFCAGSALAVTAIPVTITNANLPVSGAVKIINTPGTQLIVDADTAARAAIDGQCEFNLNASGNGSCILTTVPSNKTLVIEMLTCAASVNHVNNPFSQLPIQLIMTATGANTNYWFLLSPYLSLTNGQPQLDYYRLATPVKLYATSVNNGDLPIWLDAQIGDHTANIGGVTCSISGYLVTK